ncbi:thiolase C-terminal domain-containing protein [Amycolatopsis pithecellobii]|uniref:Lipid-transfer protein n=1 Tax=Amycolatopsis pithecellobii TaxID=664692 RepID=A0A6N7Z4T7_9PSEU|nr:lipid-transfer protein [Amycolatopsis pithecellobii]MTD54296.1 lipid-transfer protein [Amycolatopsis pithecellobii]
MSWALRNKVAIVGIGQTAFTKPGASGRSAFSLAIEATLGACADAGVRPTDVDGFVTYGVESTDPYTLAETLGVEKTTFMDRYPGGGEGLAGVVHHAAMAIHAGVADTVVAYRSLSGRLYLGNSPEISAEDDNGFFRKSFLFPFGVTVPAQFYAMHARRHMIDFGTTSEQFGAYAVNQNRNAQRNPNAIHYGRPITVEDHQSSRVVADPYRLYDCTQEADGACAVVITGAERAAGLPHKPAFVVAAAEGSGPSNHLYTQVRHQSRFNTAGFVEIAEDLYRRAGLGPSDMDVAQIFETFTGQGMMALEDFGFCGRGESGPFVESGSVGWPDGEVPINTAGGGLAEAYIHGFNNLVEGVRQLRGTSTSQVAGASTCLVTAGPGAMPSSALILANEPR